MAQRREINNSDETILECTVAAILTAALCGGMAPAAAVRRYAEVLESLRSAGGPIRPGHRADDA